MSAAELPNQDFDVAETPDAIAPAPPPDDEWETVPFPGALNVDALPRATEPSPATELAETTIPPSPAAESPAAPELQQVELDFAMPPAPEPVESTLAAVPEPTDAPAIAAPTPDPSDNAMELTEAREHIQRLFRELESACATSQHQQELIEELNQQLAASQERLADLEQECQEYQELYEDERQQRLAADMTCQDLRARLYRQQQHNLQLKTALERSLERVNPYQEQAEAAIAAFHEEAAEAADPERPALAPRNQPVQPWGVGDAPEPGPEANVVPFQSLAPEPVDMEAAPVVAEAPAAIAPATTDAHSAVSDDTPAPAAEDPQWNDLARPTAAAPPSELESAEPESSVSLVLPLESVASASSETDLEPPAPTATPEPITDPAAEAAALMDDALAAADAPTPAAEDSEDTEMGAEAPLPPLPLINAPAHTTDTAEAGEASAVVFTGVTAGPSPVLYPQRPTKKRESLAAVDLPSFPRPRGRR